MKVKVGKQSAPFTLHGSTSSKKLYTLERGKVARNIWFTNEYFTGASISEVVETGTTSQAFILVTKVLNLTKPSITVLSDSFRSAISRRPITLTKPWFDSI